MEFESTNDENSFDPTPRLKSNPIPIKFISFNWEDENCVYCEDKYIETLFCRKFYPYNYRQKYCNKCLLSYINDINDIPDNNNIYLDIYCTIDLEYSMITKVPQNIQKCYGNCLRILCFKQISGRFIEKHRVDDKIHTLYDKVIENERNCKLCRKSLSLLCTHEEDDYFMLCSECYQISFGLIESTLAKKQISILCLPWWHNNPKCDACYSRLTFASDCQKFCGYCYIFYVGCRYCLTTNIIFGPTGQSQCRKCSRISLISEYSGLDDFLYNNIIYDKLYNLEIVELTDIGRKIDIHFNPINILYSIFNKIIKKDSIRPIKWIPYSQFTNVEEMTEGGCGIIYRATWSRNNEVTILKRFKNSKIIDKYFLNEVESYQNCFRSFRGHIIEIYGCTKDPKLDDYILVMKYAPGGDLHKYLQKNFTSITWNKQKLQILWEISEGLEHIHKKEFMHRDFHSGNILFDPIDKYRNYKWKIGDLGSTQAVDNKPNNEIYGVVPYIAPEIFKGSEFTKEADIYSLGMIMWELTSGCKPFANVKHDIRLIYKILDGERPKITEDTPECYANLMKRCWDTNPIKRPSIRDICLTFGRWSFKDKNEAEFNQAEEKRKKLIESKKIGPKFAEKYHSEAIYISRPLSALVSECISTCSSSTILSDSNYNSAELGFDIDAESLLLQNSNSTTQNSTTDPDYISAELEFDIDTESSSS